MNQFEVDDFEKLFQTCTNKTEVELTYKLIAYRLKLAKERNIDRIKKTDK
jgi:hypothetical protein